MSDASSKSPELKLPASVVSKLDLARLVIELEQLDLSMTSEAARSAAGTASNWQPVLSRQLSDFLALNELAMDSSNQRANIIKGLQRLKRTLPIVHMTFAASADSESLQQITDWVRSTIHSQAVIDVGLQPDIVGGVYIRTPNQAHDLSLRSRLAGHRDIIIREVEALRAGN